MSAPALAAARERLVTSGVRLTPQRFMVLEALAGASGHTTADRILATVQTRYPYVNKTTVYRTLDLLADLGLVAVTHTNTSQTQYELIESRHHHLVCRTCGLVIELPDSTLNPLRAQVEREHGFRPYLDHFTLVGVCRACQAGAAASAGAR